MAFNDIIDTSLPPGAGDPAEADDNMRRIQGGFQELLDVDHLLEKTGTEISGADSGEHRKITLRTLSAAVVAALAATKAYLYRLVTDGELYWKDDDDNTIQLTDKGNNLANDTFLTATNEADDGSVDLIKAGKNEADDADVAIISDAARLASDAAPDENTGLANKKYVDDQIAAGADPSYTGGESHTLAGGLIMKMGTSGSMTQNTAKTITFGTAFPNGIVSASAQLRYNANDPTATGLYIKSKSTSNLVVYNTMNHTVTCEWIAIGY